MTLHYRYMVREHGKNGGSRFFNYDAAIKAAQRWRNDTNIGCTVMEIAPDGTVTPIAQIMPKSRPLNGA